jgi:hypothetical protein
MALTHGDKAVDYEKIRVTVCGLETLTPTVDQPLLFTY